MLFSELCDISDRLDSNPGHAVSVGLVSDCLQGLEGYEVYPAIRLLLNEPTPIWDQGFSPLDVRILASIACENSGLSRKNLSSFIEQTNDLATAIELAFARRRRSRNRQETGTTIEEAYLRIRELLKERHGRKAHSPDMLRELFDTLRPDEVRFVVRNLIFDGRIKSYEGILEESISKLSSIDLSEVRHKNALVNDIALVGQAVLSEGKEGFSKLSLEVLRPIKPMTAVTAQSIGETIEEYRGLVGYEFKPDGIRAQIHKLKDKVRFFDRKLKDISHLLPHLAQKIVENIQAETAVLEGEVVSRDSQGKMIPYTELIGELRSRELGHDPTSQRSLDLELFEILLLNNQNLMGITYTRRRAVLTRISGRIQVISQIKTTDPNEAESFYSKAIKDGYEGVIAKHLYSSYIPGVRTKYWAKIRESPKTLDLVILFVYPPSKKEDTDQAYLLGSRDLRANRVIPVATCSEGLSADERRWLDKKLERVTLEETGKGRFVLPRVVLEVSFLKVKRCSSTPGGYWLDSPKAVRVRFDKSPMEIDSLQWIKKLAQAV